MAFNASRKPSLFEEAIHAMPPRMVRFLRRPEPVCMIVFNPFAFEKENG
jgi:hypothetical protein